MNAATSQMLRFCLQSLLREYGWQFATRVALSHPVRTAKAVLAAARHDYSVGTVAAFGADPPPPLGGERCVVGVGFCLKPVNPACPSGRANHDCHYLENLQRSGVKDMPECCRQCAIRRIGTMALKTGAAFYIMTSAKDILFDLFMPSLERGRYSSGLFVLCRYSFMPFAVGLAASGIRGWMLPFERGDCQDYKTWLRADRGIKDEQTCLGQPTADAIRELLGDSPTQPVATGRFSRQGNMFVPCQP